jgi:hypothetical protein
VSNGKHSERLPEDCKGCRTVFAILVADQENPPVAPATVAVIAQRAGVGVRVTQMHLGHLVTHRRVQEDRRTPVEGAQAARGRQAPDDADPLAWASCQEVPDGTCARCLLEYARAAGRTWSGQLGVEQLAAALGVSERTARTHRGHLATARLIRFTPSTVLLSEHGQRLRRPDRFVLLSGEIGAPVLVADGGWFDDAAASMLAQLPWFRANKRDTERTRKAIAKALRSGQENGWTDAAILDRLLREPDGPVRTGYGRVLHLLPDVSQPYIVPAREAVGIVRRLRECPTCGDPVNPAVTHCGGFVCVNPHFGTDAPVVDLAVVRQQANAFISAS